MSLNHVIIYRNRSDSRMQLQLSPCTLLHCTQPNFRWVKPVGLGRDAKPRHGANPYRSLIIFLDDSRVCLMQKNHLNAKPEAMEVKNNTIVLEMGKNASETKALDIIARGRGIQNNCKILISRPRIAFVPVHSRGAYAYWKFEVHFEKCCSLDSGGFLAVLSELSTLFGVFFRVRDSRCFTFPWDIFFQSRYAYLPDLKNVYAV